MLLRHAMVAMAFGLTLFTMTPATTAPAEALPAFMSIGDEGRGPWGWFDFCTREPAECRTAPTVQSAQLIPLTDEMLDQLYQINLIVNSTIKPMSDLKHYGVVEYWAYPHDKKGDCEDYALLKRKMLRDLGWPQESLLLTVVRDWRNEGHTVLTVHTELGDFILDNMSNAIVRWYEAPYRFFSRQSTLSSNKWMSVIDDYVITSKVETRK